MRAQQHAAHGNSRRPMHQLPTFASDFRAYCTSCDLPSFGANNPYPIINNHQERYPVTSKAMLRTAAQPFLLMPW
jgi:hypothetical protein